MKHTLTALLALTPALWAADPIYVTDNATSANEAIWRLDDLNGDGDYNDAGECVKFYDDTLPGAIDLSNNSGVKLGSDGSLYVCDSSIDIVLRVRDLNSDGDGNDAGEATVFFNGTVGGNLSGVVMASANNLTISTGDVVWVASAGTSGGGNDAIIRLQDSNNDGDANDLGEALEYYNINPGASTGAWLPMAVAMGPDNKLYYTENGTDAALVKGIYRLDDINNNGVIDSSAEAFPYFLPTPGPTNNQFHWNLAIDAQGYFYIGDTTFEQIWRCKDLNGDNDAQDAGESVLWWSGGITPSLIWDFVFMNDGSMLACESQTPDRLLRFLDEDCDGLISALEVTPVYDETLQTAIGDVRGICAAGTLGRGTSEFCFGDGIASTLCPCANFGTCRRGCENSAGTGGAKLRFSGELFPDNAVLTCEGTLPTALSIVLQGSGELAVPLVFGDGVRCVGGTLKRLYVKNAVGGTVVAPLAGDNSISAQSALLGDPITPGTTRSYQVYYRDPNLGFCATPTGNSWNVSTGIVIRW